MAITYCIVCNITGEKYYGSTINSLEKRLREHKGVGNTCCSKQIIERGDYDIYTLHEYDTEEESKDKEKWYVDNKECINKYNVCLTDEERKENNMKKCKKYRENNPEKSKEAAKKYEMNKEVILERQRNHYQENKEKILERMKEKAECEFCKFIGYKRHLKTHQKSKRCLEYQKNV